MFTKNFNRIFNRQHLWIHVCCCVFVIGYAFIAEAHEPFPSFIERGEVFPFDVRPVNLYSELQFGYGLQKERVDTWWPICPGKKENAEFGNNSLTEGILGFSPSVLFISSPGQVVVSHDLNNEDKGDAGSDAIDKPHQINVETKKRSHGLSYSLGLVFGMLLGAFLSGMMIIPDDWED